MSETSAQVRLLSFGPLRSVFGGEGELCAIAPGETVSGLLGRLETSRRLPAEVLRSAAVAVNLEYATAERVLADGDEVALLPPVSGGSGEAPAAVRVALQREPIDSAALEQQVRSGADGAVCVFDGRVRNQTRGRATLHLDYEAYEEMALRQMQQLREGAISRFGVREVAIVHRLGRLVVGESSVLIVVASEHRGPAFEACRWVIDTLKKTVPIWKREQFVDGAVWADGEPFPESLTGTLS